jgi:hypothetical protein
MMPDIAVRLAWRFGTSGSSRMSEVLPARGLCDMLRGDATQENI